MKHATISQAPGLEGQTGYGEEEIVQVKSLRNFRTLPYVRQNTPKTRSHLRYFDVQGKKFSYYLLEQIKLKAFWVRILFIAITAGPLTYIGVHGGYYMALGEAPRAGLVSYISFVTVLTSGFSLAFDTFLQARSLDYGRKANEHFKEVISTIMDLITYTKNEQLEKLAESEKKYEIAFQVLKDPNATENGIKYAIGQLPCCPKELKREIVHIEALRRRGLFFELHTVANKRRDIHLEYIRTLPEGLQRILNCRLSGRLPNRRLGHRRSRGFIKSFIKARDPKKIETITPSDCEEMLKVILELLSSRNFGVLKWKLKQDNEISTLINNIEELKLKIRVLHRRLRLGLMSESQFHKRLASKKAQLKKIERDFEDKISQTSDLPKANLYLEIDPLTLTDGEKSEIIKELYDSIESIFFHPQLGEVIDLEADDQSSFLEKSDLTELILKMFTVLEKHIDLSHDATIEYIELSPTISISSIDISAPRNFKIDYLHAAIDELMIHVNPQIEQALKRFRESYKLPLSEKAIKRVNKQFNFPLERLDAINK